MVPYFFLLILYIDTRYSFFLQKYHYILKINLTFNAVSAIVILDRKDRNFYTIVNRR